MHILPKQNLDCQTQIKQVELEILNNLLYSAPDDTSENTAHYKNAKKQRIFFAGFQFVIYRYIKRLILTNMKVTNEHHEPESDCLTI